MRSEDRKPSKRVFPLLQNLDLDTVTFANVQGVGDPITIEDMNEQELQDLVLVNLARLVVSGEWTGLLEAGGGGSNAFVTGAADLLTGWGIDYLNFAMTAPWADQGNVTTVNDSDAGDPLFYPFIAGNTGTIENLTVVVTGLAADTTYEFGIYSADTDVGLPDSLLGSATFDASSAATVTVTGLSIDITRGEPYWYAWVRNSGSNTATFKAASITSASPVGNSYQWGTGTGTAMKDYVNNDALPATSANDEIKPMDSYHRPFLIMGL